MKQVNIHEAKTHLSKLIQAAENGEEVVIARAGKPAVKLVPCAEEAPTRRNFGLLEGKMWMSDDFDDPLPDEIQAAFEGRAD